MLDSEITEFDLLFEVPGKQAAVFSLQILLLPVLARDDSPACWAAAPALDRIDRVIGGGPIVGQLLAGGDFTQRNKYDLTLHGGVWIARVITRDHRVIGMNRANEQMVRDLDLAAP